MVVNNKLVMIITSCVYLCAGNAVNEERSGVEEYCYKDNKCQLVSSRDPDSRFIFYDVNSAEGFNLRRDVYLRMAIFVHGLRDSHEHSNFVLVLPPWFNLYHWRIASGKSRIGPFPWSNFFDLDSLQSFVPVTEIQDAFKVLNAKKPFIDRIYVLHNFEDAFDSDKFVEKWRVMDACKFKPDFWGYHNITYGSVECVEFLGGASKLSELLALHSSDQTVMFADAQIALHEHYNDKLFWTARKSMQFSDTLIKISSDFIQLTLECDKEKCDNYISVHWRRGDFAQSRKKDVPSISSASSQIGHLCDNLNIYRVFIATDASMHELGILKKLLQDISIEVFNFVVNKADNLSEGQVAIIDQIICSRSAYFIGSHESTFSFRIQEEREILGFNSDTTFNRLCPDKGRCQKPSKWKIVQ